MEAGARMSAPPSGRKPLLAVNDRTLHIHCIPDDLRNEDIAGCQVVVVDVLRATTTITTALVNGACGILPVPEISAAVSDAKQSPLRPLLGGERDAKKIAGFDLGNSPLEYTRERIGDHYITLSTSHGTKAILRSIAAHAVFIGCFRNLTSVSRLVSQSPLPLHIVCAGTDGRPSIEDTLCAITLAERLVLLGWEPSPNFKRLMENYSGDLWAERVSMMLGGAAARRLGVLQYTKDIEFALQIDCDEAVPVVNPQTKMISLPGG